MKNIKKITYFDIKNLLISNDLNPISNLDDNEFFNSLNSISNANEYELTFFNDTSQLNKLEKTKAKACLINKEYLKYLPTFVLGLSAHLTIYSYQSFAYLCLFIPGFAFIL